MHNMHMGIGRDVRSGWQPSTWPTRNVCLATLRAGEVGIHLYGPEAQSIFIRLDDELWLTTFERECEIRELEIPAQDVHVTLGIWFLTELPRVQ